MKGCISLKKICIILCVFVILTLCSCRKLNNTDNNIYTSNSSSDFTDLNSSLTSSLVLPEREEPGASSKENISNSDEMNSLVSNDETTTQPSQSNTSNPSYDETNTSYGETDESIPEVKPELLNIETTQPDYDIFTDSITFTIFSNNKSSFAYYTDFFLQKYENDKWNYVTTKSGIIDYKFNVAIASSYVEFITMDLSDLYEAPLSSGRYRIIQQSDEGTIASNAFGIIEKTIEVEIENTIE